MAQTNFTPISLYFSTTAAAAPSAGNLVNGELAINITDGKLYYKDNAGVVKVIAGAGGAGIAGGSNTQVQFNSSGNLAGSANLTFNGTTLTANTIGAFTLGGTIAGGGNQINNVIIGTSTPLAGNFTTLGASSTATLNTLVSSGATLTGGSINGMTVGATTASTGAFTTLGATGVATFSAGTVSAPAITTTGDTNTGIFFPAADTIAFTEGGVESMRITSAGDVGIGTSSPSEKLQVTSTTAFSFLRLSNSSNSVGGGVVGVDTVNMDVINKEAGYLRFGTSNAERMRITSAGDVGIGTSSPTQKFEVSGSSTTGARIFGGSGAGFLEVANSTVQSRLQAGASDSFIGNLSNHPLLFITNNAERMRIASNGNVSIGTTVTDQRFTVHSSAATSSTPFANSLIQVRANAVNADGTIQFTDTALYNSYIGAGGGSMYFATNGTTERMRIDSSGNVLVGTTNADPITAQADGISLGSDKIIRSSLNSTPCAAFARRGTDGAIINLIKGTTEVGSIRVATTGVTYNGTNGIVFTATQTASADANTLDDYEEGTWTPVYTASTTNPTMEYNATFGRYTKIGRLVTCYFHLRTNTSSTGGGVGNLQLSGLPFTSANIDANGGKQSGCIAQATNFGVANFPNAILVQNNSTSCDLLLTSTTVATTNVDASTLTLVNQGNNLFGAFSYII